MNLARVSRCPALSTPCSCKGCNTAPLPPTGVQATPLPLILARAYGNRWAWQAWREQFSRSVRRSSGLPVPYSPGPRARLTLYR